MLYNDLCIGGHKSYFWTRLMALALAIKLRRLPSQDQAVHYRGIKSRLTTVKMHWPGNEKIIDSILSTYEGMVIRVSQRVAEIHHIDKNIDEVIETTRGFFRQLLWQYDLNSVVNFTKFVSDHLFYRVKNYYNRQNRTSAYLETISSAGYEKNRSKISSSGSNDDHIEEDHRVRYVGETPSSLNNKYTNIQSNEDDPRHDRGINRLMAADMWRGMVRHFCEEDIDLVICSDLLNMKQREISSIFGMTQPHVCGARREIINRMRRFMEAEA